MLSEQEQYATPHVSMRVNCAARLCKSSPGAHPGLQRARSAWRRLGVLLNCSRLTMLLQKVCIFCFCLLSLAVHAEPVITLSIPSVYISFVHTEEQTGFADEVVGQALRRLGYQLEVAVSPTARSMQLANAGVVDGELLRVAGMEKNYPNLVPVTENVMNAEFVVFSREPMRLTDGWQGLNGKTVGIVIGMKIIEDNMPDGAQVTPVASPEQLFQLLQKNRADCVVFYRLGGVYFLNKLDMSDIEVSSQHLARTPSYVYLNKKHAHLADKLSAVLAEMKVDGSYQRLVDHHVSNMGLQDSNQWQDLRERFDE